jgi:hypothetical protein
MQNCVIELVPLPHNLHGDGGIAPFRMAKACLPQKGFFVGFLQYSCVPFTNQLHIVIYIPNIIFQINIIMNGRSTSVYKNVTSIRLKLIMT